MEVDDAERASCPTHLRQRLAERHALAAPAARHLSLRGALAPNILCKDSSSRRAMLRKLMQTRIPLRWTTEAPSDFTSGSCGNSVSAPSPLLRNQCGH